MDKCVYIYIYWERDLQIYKRMLAYPNPRGDSDLPGRTATALVSTSGTSKIFSWTRTRQSEVPVVQRLDNSIWCIKCSTADKIAFGTIQVKSGFTLPAGKSFVLWIKLSKTLHWIKFKAQFWCFSVAIRGPLKPCTDAVLMHLSGSLLLYDYCKAEIPLFVPATVDKIISISIKLYS